MLCNANYNWVRVSPSNFQILILNETIYYILIYIASSRLSPSIAALASWIHCPNRLPFKQETAKPGHPNGSNLQQNLLEFFNRQARFQGPSFLNPEPPLNLGRHASSKQLLNLERFQILPSKRVTLAFHHIDNLFGNKKIWLQKFTKLLLP